MRLRKFIAIIILLCLVISCSVKKDSVEEEDNATAEELYNKAMILLQKKDLKDAAATFGRVAYEFPYHEWANRAEVMEIYVHYLMAEYEIVITSADQYVKLHPASPEVPYVFYLKALSYYEQIDIPYRDQTSTVNAKDALIELIQRFPNSDYSKDARIKLDLVNDHLAAHEMAVGRYYLSNGSILSAIDRFKTVVDEYNRTSHIQEALYRLTEAYLFLGLKEEAKRNAAVLGFNFPNSKWYKESYNLVNK
jgi:outer membrane protein assembly factor BamD